MNSSPNTLTNKGVLLLLFCISPILAFTFAVKKIKNKSYHFIILMFAFLFGFTFIPYENSDTERYIKLYTLVNQLSFTDYVNAVFSVYTEATNLTDIYLISLMFITSFFGASFKFFIGVQSVIYFSIFLGILKVIFDQVKSVDYRKYIVFMLGCVFIYSFTAGINNIRFPTAFMFFVYFSLKYLFNQKLKYFYFASLSILIHPALLQPFFGLTLFVVLNKINNVFFRVLSLLVFGLFLFTLNIQQVSSIIGNDTITEKIEDYTNENYIEQREQHTTKWNWYIRFNQYSYYYFLTIVVFLTMFKLKGNPTTKRLFLMSIILFLISIFNEIYLDSISNRYRQFFEFFALVYLIVLFASTIDSKFKRNVKKFFFFILLVNMLISFRSLSYNLDILRLTISPFINFFDFDSVSIYELF
jgi:hypothetical protein